MGGAVDMCKVVLKYGKDEQMKIFCTDIIGHQATEIEWMKQWLSRNTPANGCAPSALSTTSFPASPLPARVPASLASTAPTTPPRTPSSSASTPPTPPLSPLLTLPL